MYRRLTEHPDVFAPDNKEPRFYALPEGEQPPAFSGPGDDGWLSHFITDPDEHAAMYADAPSGTLKLDGSTDYLLRSAVAAPRLAKANPDARIIFMLRHPADRAFSNWTYHRGPNREPLSFEGALDAEEGRKEAGWAWWWWIRERGLYASQLEPFLDWFPSNVKVLFYDQLEEDPDGLFADVLAFLDLADIGADVGKRRENVSVPELRPGWREFTYRAYRKLLRPKLSTQADERITGRIESVVMRQHRMSPQTAQELTEYYKPEIDALEILLGQDLEAWR